mmetsp:Transcript_150849/g.263640  ORF Transcript_150849/g.263640 Transcript_150849/m.263640 type:complete len:627 (-) Transcript_150849:423-2303(-)
MPAPTQASNNLARKFESIVGRFGLITDEARLFEALQSLEVKIIPKDLTTALRAIGVQIGPDHPPLGLGPFVDLVAEIDKPTNPEALHAEDVAQAFEAIGATCGQEASTIQKQALWKYMSQFDLRAETPPQPKKAEPPAALPPRKESESLFLQRIKSFSLASGSVHAWKATAQNQSMESMVGWRKASVLFRKKSLARALEPEPVPEPEPEPDPIVTYEEFTQMLSPGTDQRRKSITVQEKRKVSNEMSDEERLRIREEQLQLKKKEDEIKARKQANLDRFDVEYAKRGRGKFKHIHQDISTVDKEVMARAAALFEGGFEMDMVAKPLIPNQLSPEQAMEKLDLPTPAYKRAESQQFLARQQRSLSRISQKILSESGDWDSSSETDSATVKNDSFNPRANDSFNPRAVKNVSFNTNAVQPSSDLTIALDQSSSADDSAASAASSSVRQKRKRPPLHMRFPNPFASPPPVSPISSPNRDPLAITTKPKEGKRLRGPKAVLSQSMGNGEIRKARATPAPLRHSLPNLPAMYQLPVPNPALQPSPNGLVPFFALPPLQPAKDPKADQVLKSICKQNRNASLANNSTTTVTTSLATTLSSTGPTPSQGASATATANPKSGRRGARKSKAAAR